MDAHEPFDLPVENSGLSQSWVGRQWEHLAKKPRSENFVLENIEEENKAHAQCSHAWYSGNDGQIFDADIDGHGERSGQQDNLKREGPFAED